MENGQNRIFSIKSYISPHIYECNKFKAKQKEENSESENETTRRYKSI
jgi:hypothetical protein